MSDLDKKLEEKLLDVIEENQYIDGEFMKFATDSEKQRAIGNIEQAFIDGGWVNMRIPNHAEGGTVELVVDGYMTREEWEAKAIKDGLVKIITGECTHPDFKKRNCRLNHECEYCVFCGEERHMSVSEQDSHDKPNTRDHYNPYMWKGLGIE